jgi:hypothetical protein
MNSLSCEQGERFALGHHARAISRAYDETLAEACALIGVSVSLDSGVDRLMAEGTLVQAGWSW